MHDYAHPLSSLLHHTPQSLFAFAEIHAAGYRVVLALHMGHVDADEDVCALLLEADQGEYLCCELWDGLLLLVVVAVFLLLLMR